MAYRVLKPNDMPKIERRCPECDGIVMQRSTGRLLYNEGNEGLGHRVLLSVGKSDLPDECSRAPEPDRQDDGGRGSDEAPGSWPGGA